MLLIKLITIKTSFRLLFLTKTKGILNKIAVKTILVIYLKNPFLKSERQLTFPVKNGDGDFTSVSEKTEENLAFVKEKLDCCSDVLYRRLEIGSEKAALVFCDGLCNSVLLNEGIIKPLTEIKAPLFTKRSIYETVTEKTYSGSDFKSGENLNDIFPFLFSGCAILFADGMNCFLAFSVQGFEKRGFEEPHTEVQEKGTMEGFVETLTDNIALLRRKLKTPFLKTEEIIIGSTSNTRVAVCYLSDRADKKTVESIKNKLKEIKIDSVLSSDYLAPYLDSGFLSLFSAVGRTERPDTLCSKLGEGRVGIIADGSPFAVFLPFLFTENFQASDDYCHRPFYSFFIRCLRLLCFFLSAMLPGIYVAVCVYHQEVLSQALLVEIAVQENVTPFSITAEALTVHIMYEIVREAGLRMPKAVGHAVSIVGALVIGEAAVSAGIIAAPMVIIVALTAIGSFVVSPVYESVSVLRLVFIIIGGMSGFFGIMLFFGACVINICALNSENVPFSATLITANIGSFRDVLFRLGWKKLGRRVLKIDRLEK